MKGPFSIWAFFGLTLWIDIISLIFIKKSKRINPYKPLKEVSIIIPIHQEPENYVEDTVKCLFDETYPLKSIIVCGDEFSRDFAKSIFKLSKIYSNVYFFKCPHQSKAKKINWVVKNYKNILGEFIYIRDCRVRGNKDCIEKMVSYFDKDDVSAVTSYGRLGIPKNFLSRSYYYGKAWVNEIGRFRKNAQERRKAVFVICGASTMFRRDILEGYPIPSGSLTEDTYYTWVLQKKGFEIRVADDAIVSAPEVDGTGLDGLKAQIKQSYRWSSGTIQCMYREGRHIFKNKRLCYTTIFPGFIESVMYSIPLLLLPIILFIFPVFSIGFLIGDTLFSLIGTAIILPRKFLKTLVHYPQIFFFKYLNSAIFLVSLYVVTKQAITNKTFKWNNEWKPPKTNI